MVACVIALLGLLTLVGATVRAMYEASRPVVLQAQGDKDDAISIAFSPDGDVIAKASRRGARLLSIPDGKVVRTFSGPDLVLRIAFAPGGERVVTGDRWGKVVVWSARTGDVERRLPGHKGRVLALAISPDGNLVASSGDDRVRVSSIADGSVPLVFPSMYAEGIAFSPSGDRMAFSDRPEGTSICSLSDGATVLKLPRDCSDVAFARDGASLALALGDGSSVEIHDATTGALLRSIAVSGSANSVHVVGMPAQDAWVVSWDAAGRPGGGEIGLFSARDGTCVRSFTVPSFIQCLAVSPDGARIAAGCGDGSIWIWRTSSPFAFGR
jgi:WD40 repeat protein